MPNPLVIYSLILFKIPPMNLLTMMYTTQQIAQAFGKPVELSLEQWNNYLDIAQMEIFKEFADGYVAGNGAVVSARVDAALSPFMGNSVYTSSSWSAYTSGGSAFGVPCLVFNVESGIYRVLSAYAVDTTESYPDKLVKIDIVTSNEAVERMNNSITYPTTDFPIMYLDKDGGATQFIATVMPTGFTKIMLTHLIYPPTPSLVITYSNDVPTQSGSSVDLYITEPFKIDVIRTILKYIGLSVGNAQIQQFVETQKINEK